MEYAEGLDIGYIVFGEANIFDIFDYLFEACGDAESPVIGHLPEKVVEVGPLVLLPGDEVSPNHGQFI
jgi:hypothetical protein